jgi:magnesium transporter
MSPVTNSPILSDPQVARQILKKITKQLESGKNLSKLKTLISGLHPADIADVLEVISSDDRLKILTCIPEDSESEVFLDLEPSIRAELLNHLSVKTIARIINDLETDDAINVIEHLPFEQQTMVIRLLSKKDQGYLSEALSHDEDSAARLMQREFVAVPRFWTISQVKMYIRTADFIPEKIYNIYIIDANHKPLGYISLSELLRHDEDERVSHFMEKEVFAISLVTPKKEVAFYFRHYGLASAPVVDMNGCIVGNITLDHMVDIIDQQAEREFLGMTGAGTTDTHASIVTTAAHRFKWIGVTAISSIISAYIVSKFEYSIEKIVALAALMSVVVSISGTVSLQVASVTIRAISMREFRFVKMWYSVWKEIQVGFVNGLLISTVLLFVVAFWYSPALAFVFAVSILFNVMYGSIIGISIPALLYRFNFDPAISAPPFLIPACDMVGYGSFLYIATIFLL